MLLGSGIRRIAWGAETAPIHDVDVDAGPREREGQRRAGRAPTDDEHLRIGHLRTLSRKGDRNETAGRGAEKIDEVIVQP